MTLISFYPGKHVIEIGAGCGIVGITAAALGARSVVLTDLKSQQSHLLRNIELNYASWDSSCTSVSAGVLSFGDTSVTDNIPQIACDSGCSPDLFDVVLGADVGYDLSLHEPIARTVTSLLSSHLPCKSSDPPFNSVLSHSSTIATKQPVTRTALLAEEVRWRDIHCWYLESLSKNSREVPVDSNGDETLSESRALTPRIDSMGVEEVEEEKEDASDIQSSHTVTNSDRYNKLTSDTPTGLTSGTYSHSHSLLYEGGGKNSTDRSQVEDEVVPRKSRNSIHLLSISWTSDTGNCEQNS